MAWIYVLANCGPDGAGSTKKILFPALGICGCLDPCSHDRASALTAVFRASHPDVSWLLGSVSEFVLGLEHLPYMSFLMLTST